MLLSTIIKREVKREVATSRKASESDNKNVYKITVRAHFQLPNKSGHKFKSAASTPSQKIDSDEILTFDDLRKCLRNLSSSSTKCGVFDEFTPPAIRMLDYLGGTKEFCTRSEEIQELPSEFIEIIGNKTIDIGVCNLNTGAAASIKRKFSDPSSFSSSKTIAFEPTHVITLKDSCEDDSCMFVSDSMLKTKPSFQFKYDRACIPLKFDFGHGKSEGNTSSSTTSISSSTNSSSRFSQRVVLYEANADFKE